MTTYTERTDGTQTVKNLTTVQSVVQNVVDFSDTNYTAPSSADVVTVLKIPADCVVVKVGWFTITADSTATGTLGDGTTADGWDAAVDFTTIKNNGFSTEGTDTYGLGKFYYEADTIDLTLSADSGGDGKVLFFAEIINLQDDLA